MGHIKVQESQTVSRATTCTVSLVLGHVSFVTTTCSPHLATGPLFAGWGPGPRRRNRISQLVLFRAFEVFLQPCSLPCSLLLWFLIGLLLWSRLLFHILWLLPLWLLLLLLLPLLGFEGIESASQRCVCCRSDSATANSTAIRTVWCSERYVECVCCVCV